MHLLPRQTKCTGWYSGDGGIGRAHPGIHHFNLERHLIDRQTCRERRSAALAEWQTLVS